jgi:hypothetical protein
MNSRAIAGLTAALTVSIGTPALADTYLRIVNATTEAISIERGTAKTPLPPQHYAPRSLPVFIYTSAADTNGSFYVFDRHDKCTAAQGDTEGWDIEVIQGKSALINFNTFWNDIFHGGMAAFEARGTRSDFCIRLKFAEVGCLITEVHKDSISFSKVADTECANAD